MRKNTKYTEIDTELMLFAAWIVQQTREDLNLTRKKLSEISGVSVQDICGIEHFSMKTDPLTAARVLKSIGYNIRLSRNGESELKLKIIQKRKNAKS